MRGDWYYSGPEGQVGPMSLQKLKGTLMSHPNAKDVYIWHDSLPEWVRAGDLAEIVAKRTSTALRDESSFDQVDLHLDSFAAAAREASWDRKSLNGLHLNRAYSIENVPLIPGETAKVAIERERHYSVGGFIAGLVVILLGCGLFYLGITG
jgi:hypothetical protein